MNERGFITEFNDVLPTPEYEAAQNSLNALKSSERSDEHAS